MPETRLEMERRHVAEGLNRIRRQEALIERLIAHGHTNLLEQAEALLADMHRFQTMAEAHLAKAEASISGSSNSA